MAAKSLLDAREACAYLGVKPQTLYAYVSRGQLHAEPSPEGRGNLYLKSDLEALRARSRARAGHGPAAAGALRWGEPVLESGITLIRTGRIHYRGHALDELLAQGASFEAVAELLWSGDLPREPRAWRSTPATGGQKDGPLARRLFASVGKLALMDQDADDETLDLALSRARRIIVAAAAEVTRARIDPVRGLAAEVASALGADHATAAVTCTLIVSADHELNASTFAARVAASTGADLYASLLAGLGTFSGRKHGLASFEAYGFLKGCIATRKPRPLIDAYLRRRELLPGFGHSLYADGDPRLPPLLEVARLATGARAARVLDTAEATMACAEKLRVPHANIDFGLAVLCLAFDWPIETGAGLFAVGRIAGWTAHVLEQRQLGIMLRPRARYVGREPSKL